MQSHPQNEPTVEDEYNLGTLWMMAAVPAMMSQPQSREESVPNNFSKIRPNRDFKIDPLPLVSAMFCCRKAESKLQLFILPGSLFHTSACEDSPVKNLSMQHIAKNKVIFPFKARKVINPRTPLPSTPGCSLLPHTLLPSPAHVLCAGKLVTWGKKKGDWVMRSYHYHISIPVLSLPAYNYHSFILVLSFSDFDLVLCFISFDAF